MCVITGCWCADIEFKIFAHPSLFKCRALNNFKVQSTKNPSSFTYLSLGVNLALPICMGSSDVPVETWRERGTIKRLTRNPKVLCNEEGCRFCDICQLSPFDSASVPETGERCRQPQDLRELCGQILGLGKQKRRPTMQLMHTEVKSNKTVQFLTVLYSERQFKTGKNGQDSNVKRETMLDKDQTGNMRKSVPKDPQFPCTKSDDAHMPKSDNSSSINYPDLNLKCQCQDLFGRAGNTVSSTRTQCLGLE